MAVVGWTALIGAVVYGELRVVELLAAGATCATAAAATRTDRQARD